MTRDPFIGRYIEKIRGDTADIAKTYKKEKYYLLDCCCRDDS
jgi:hypothetical protein